MVERIFLDYSIRKLAQGQGRVEECLALLSEQQVWTRGGANENTIGNLVLHLCGNIQQWVISGVGGAPQTRDRDAEFAASGGLRIPELQTLLRHTVEQGVAVIQDVQAERLTETIQVQKYEIKVLEAIYHVVEHFSGHAGQIIFMTKMLTGQDLGFYQHLKYAAHTERTP